MDSPPCHVVYEVVGTLLLLQTRYIEKKVSL